MKKVLWILAIVLLLSTTLGSLAVPAFADGVITLGGGGSITLGGSGTGSTGSTVYTGGVAPISQKDEYLATYPNPQPLVDRGNGMIYDPMLNVTWLKDVSNMPRLYYPDAQQWIQNFTFDNIGGWRLFNSIPNGGGHYGTSELGALSFIDGVKLENQSPFIGIRGEYGWEYAMSDYYVYWSEDPETNLSNHELTFTFLSAPNPTWLGDGSGMIRYITGQLSEQCYVWPVHDGDVGAVSEPSTMLLLGSGLIGLAGYGRKKFFKK